MKMAAACGERARKKMADMECERSEQPHREERAENSAIHIHLGDALEFYEEWPAPTCIVSDGPYGIDGYPGDCKSPDELALWYEPHIRAWSKSASPYTTLWLWNTELGWALTHPVLAENGWKYRACNIWDKGLGHIAGNVNTHTIRQYPVVTEVCVHYVRDSIHTLTTQEGDRVSVQDWLRAEWKRSGLALSRANEACGVANAATRKYLTADRHWYFPPQKHFERLAAYANEHGAPKGKPYFNFDGQAAGRIRRWEHMRAKFHCDYGITNVWRTPQTRAGERLVEHGATAPLHSNQKPLALIERLICSSTDTGDVVWEPFGGLCPGAVICRQHQRKYYAAEINPGFHSAALARSSAPVQEPLLSQ